MNPTADPAANTVFDHNTFSAVNGSTLGTNGTPSPPTLDALMEKVPTKEWMSLMGASAT
jgi:hypothetical protein